MNEINKALEALKDEDGENRAVRAFLMIYGTPGLTAAAMAAHMRRSGFDYVPAWVERSPEFLTKAGAQLWLRMLFALENPAAPVPGDAPPKPDREDARRYCHPGFQEWLDESVTENGEHTVFDLLSSVHDAYSGFCASPSYPDSKYAPSAPAAGQCGESCERAKLCGACARGLEEAQELAPISEEEIDRIAALTEKAMEDGLSGFCKTWGWQQFARTLVENLRPYGLRVSKAPAPEPVALTEAIDLDRVLSIADEHAVESNEDGTRLLDRGGLLQLAKDVAALAASQPAPVEARPTDDALWDTTLKQRDDYHEWADQLAARIATITGVDIGEHSSANCPWRNAVDAADEFSAPVEAQAVPEGWSIRRTPGKAEIGITTPEDGPGGMFVSPSDRDLARRVLYALCEDLTASNQNGGE